MHFSTYLEAKNEEKSMFFSVRVFDAARVFSNPATLDFAGRRSTSEGFQNFRKTRFFTKNAKNRV